MDFGEGSMDSYSYAADEDYYRNEGYGTRVKPRFSMEEVKVLLEAIKRNRYILLSRFNQGVSAEAKKQTWIEITEQINSLGENHREVRQIIKKWSDLKCDANCRMISSRNRKTRKKNFGPIEKMVHKLLMMTPKGDGDSDVELDEDGSFAKFSSMKQPYTDSNNPEYFSTPEKFLKDNELDDEDEEDEDHYFQEAEELARPKPANTYSRHRQKSPATSSQSGPPGQSSTSDHPVPPSYPSVTPLSQCAQQQRTARVLLASVARSVETLARSMQVLSQRQKEFARESLQLHRQSLDTLRDFSDTALQMLKDTPTRNSATNRYK